MGDLSIEYDVPSKRCIVCAGAIGRWGSKTAHGHDFTYDRCGRCGFVFVNPRPTRAALAWYYAHYDELTGVSAVRGEATAPVPRAGPDQRRFIRSILQCRSGPGRFLDVGSGTGLATAAAHQAGLAVTALEINPVNIEATRGLAGVEVVPLLFEQYDSGAAAFDYILMSHVLEHVHDPSGFLAKAARMLSPSGLLAVLVPSFDSVYRHLLGTGDPYFIPPTHLNHFNPASLAGLCRRVGLDVVDCRDYHDVPRNVVSKRVPRMLRPGFECATAVGASIAGWATGICGWGAFVRCLARKRLV